METQTIMVRPPHSVVLVGDRGAEPPGEMQGAIAVATSGCIAVGTRVDADGPTQVELRSRPGGMTTHHVFAGPLELPDRVLTVSSGTGDEYLVRGVSDSTATVNVWVDDLAEPSSIVE